MKFGSEAFEPIAGEFAGQDPNSHPFEPNGTGSLSVEPGLVSCEILHHTRGCP